MRFTPVQIITEKHLLQRLAAPLPGIMVTTRRISVILTSTRGVMRRVTVITRMPTVGRATTMITTKRQQPGYILSNNIEMPFTEFVYLRHLL